MRGGFASYGQSTRLLQRYDASPVCSRAEHGLQRLTVREVRRLDGLAGADVVERRSHPLEGHAAQLGPGEPVDRELERVGVSCAVGLPVDDEVAAAPVGGSS